MANLNWMTARYWKYYTWAIFKRKFKHIGKESVIFKPMRLDSTDSIVIGNHVFIGEGAWLMGSKKKNLTLRIGDGTTIGHFTHIVAINEIEIEKKVLIADKVFISDCTHSYGDITRPVMEQEILPIDKVIIGEGTWIGENVCVCGASIGKHCIIGANSVVTKNIPDYSVAVGIPAKVIKYFDFEKEKWVNN